MKTALGNRLSATDQAYARAAFVHRHTKEHRPAWLGRGDCVGASPQFASDADWLANTTFKVNANGALNRRSETCESHPTWPDNPELRPSSV